MTDIRPAGNTQGVFFNPKNEAMLDRLLYADFQRRLGTDLTEKQKDGLVKRVKHYMNEVYAKHPAESIQYLNKEVLTAVVPDFMGYLRRNGGAAVAGEDAAENTELRMDVNSRFGAIQAERQGTGAPPPVAPDFRISLDGDGPTSLSRFEEIKKQRDLEAQREAAAAQAAAMKAPGAAAASVIPARENPLSRFIDSDVDFRNSTEASRQRDQLALVMRDAERQLANASGPLYTTTATTTLPDARRMLMDEPVPQLPRSLGIAAGNPTLALPDIMRDRPALPQDVIKPQEDIISYKENEYNLFVYSADRDWVTNNTENRYNFSVNFDPANNKPGFGYSPATNIKFKNITRIEFVKAIMPTEACDVLPIYSGGSLSTALNMNILSFPYLQIRIPELNTNGYGTNDGMNNAFAAVSYEAYWTADSAANNRGYARMIPKFLKCQKTFYPTPLATLQKLTFQIQRPDGTQVCASNDTLDIAAVYMPTAQGGSGSTSYVAATFDWIWINTSTFFSRFMVTQGDRIQIKNVALNATLAANANAASMIAFLTRPEGHLVSDIGQISGSNYTTGPNAVGYANGIIIRNNFQDPSTGATAPMAWVSAIGAAVNTNPTLTTGRLINLNHQIQIILRIITRDMDAATRLRPDNLQA